ncbi:RICIN domain-containing protein [Micromonospora sp. NPDC005222]|uniref:RICIN domain-containing protein n=1 Tax=unclassified Micromonospora TaxID=2617518 RepID=UPI0033A2F920
MKLHHALATVTLGALLPTLPLAPSPAAAADAGPFWWASANSGSTRSVIDVQGPTTAEYAKVHLWEFYGGNSQYWYLADGIPGASSNTRLLRNKYSGKCIGLQGTGTANGTAVNQQTCNYGDTRQQWRQERRFEGAGNTYYRFVNVATGRCLDNATGSTADGNKIQIWGCAGDNNYNQLWY